MKNGIKEFHFYSDRMKNIPNQLRFPKNPKRQRRALTESTSSLLRKPDYSQYILIIVFGIVFFSSVFAQKQKIYTKAELVDPFEKLKCDSIVAYNFQIDSTGKKKYGQQSILLKIGDLNTTTILLPGKKLSKEQTTKLFKLLLDTLSYGGNTAAGFDPHLAFVFYGEKKILGVINISMECNYLQASPEIPASKYVYHKLDFGDGVSIVFDEGFSKKGRKALKKFCTELNMFYCVEKGKTIFD